ncbi:MAG: macro domain-containing protein [Serratia fonticola]
MRYLWESIRTTAYWRYALFSGEAVAKFFSTLGMLYLLINLADTFKIYEKGKYSNYGVLILVALAIFFVMFTRRPVSRIAYKVPKKDYSFEVKISDIFKENGEIIISSNTTFDTDMSTGLISTGSLQGQLATLFFNGQTAEIDRQIEESLAREEFNVVDGKPGKKKQYPLGTVARVSAHGKNFYFVAMSHINSEGTAYSTSRMLDEALEGLWKNMARKGDFGDMVMPLMGTGRGRVAIPRKKIIERIAQSFADAAQDRVFSNKLSIIVRPEDASKFSLNLFQVRDYLSQSLHA